MAFNARKYQADKFTSGAWVDIMGGQFKLARAANPEYDKALEASGYRNIEDDAEAKQKALYKAIAEGVIKDWSEVVDENDEPIPYSVDHAVTVLLENPDLVGRILTEANNLQNYRREDVQSQQKKAASGSGSPKNGSSPAKA